MYVHDIQMYPSHRTTPNMYIICWKLHIEEGDFFFSFLSNTTMPSLECIENAYVARWIITEQRGGLKNFLKHFRASQFELKTSIRTTNIATMF